MFEPGTSKSSSNCLLPKNSGKNGPIGRDEKDKKTRRDLIESLVSEAADRLNVQYVTKKKVKEEVNCKKRKSCSAVPEKPKSNKRPRISCEARICSEKEVKPDAGINDYLVMVNTQLKALQELPVIQKSSSTSEIQNFISKLDESQVENFLKKKADGIRSSVDSDPNARSILSFIQKKIVLPEVVAPTNRVDDTSLAGPSSSAENSKSDVSCNHDLASSENCSKKAEEENSKGDTQEIHIDPECHKHKSEVIEVTGTNDDVSEVTSTSENEITSSSSEFKIIQSKALEKLNSIDLLKLNQKDLTEFIVPLLSSKEGDSNSNSVLSQETKSSEHEMKTALKENIQNFFLQLISFADMLKTCTDIIGKEVKPKVEPVKTSSHADQKLNSHCNCCAQKSKENNSIEGNSTLKVIEVPETEGKPSNLSSLKNNSESPENIDISSTTTLDAESVSLVTSSSTVATTTESELVKDEDFIAFDDVSDDALVESKDDTPNEGIFKCKKCDYTTKSQLKLKRHVKYAKKNPLMYNHKRKSAKIS